MMRTWVDVVRTLFMVIATLLLAMMAMAWPLYSGLQLLRPQALLVAVLFWIYMRPQLFGLLFACFMGLVLDLLVGTSLGMHGLLFSLASYALLVWMPHFRFCSRGRQAIVIGGLVLATQAFHLFLQLLAHQPHASVLSLLGALPSGLLWLLLCAVFKIELNRLQLVDSW